MTKRNSAIRIPYGQAVHGVEEEKRVLAVLREHRTIMGREVAEFERSVCGAFGKKYGIMVNSGSSANLLAVELLGLRPGSEVITPILTFSTTVGPLVQKGLIPVFVDVEPGTYVVNIDQVEAAVTGKTRALVIPWLLGNVPDVARLQALVRKHKLIFVEDSCDTFAATFQGKPIGTFTDITTTSFYGSHIITAGGNGGMIMVNRDDWRDRLRVLRGWGRTSSLFSESETLTKRFRIKLHGIPYDAKFIFDEVGYNFMPSEMGAAFGNAQLGKLTAFKKIGSETSRVFCGSLHTTRTCLLFLNRICASAPSGLHSPHHKKSAPFTRLQIVTYLEKNNIQRRPIFTGNILRQPGFAGITYRRVANTFPVTKDIMECGFVVGCHHGLTVQHIERLKDLFTTFLKNYR